MSFKYKEKRMEERFQPLRTPIRLGKKLFQRNRTDEIAIIGIGCKFPGCNNVEEYWRLLRDGENHVVEIPKDRWNIDAFYNSDPNAPGKMYVRQAGFVESIYDWDHRLYGINDMEAELIDPQQRLVLDCTHMALEDAGLTKKDIDGSNTCVIIGSMTDDYKSQVMDDTSINSTYSVTGTHNSIISARPAYIYNLTGQAMTIDTACSSSLVAIDIASQAILAGSSDMAICGGVNVLMDPQLFIALCRARMLSPNGQCKAFTKDADGYARGEGCGIVILKSLQKAKADGNKIWGTIRTGTNQDGHTATPITAPSSEQQQKLIENVYRRYGVDKSKIQVIEAHGWKPGMGQAPTEGPPPDLGEMENEPPPAYTEIPVPPVMGYEGVSFSQDKAVPPPPVALPKPAGGDLPPQTFTNTGQLDEEQCREAMLQFVAENCCYGSKPAKEMKILEFVGTTALHYILETFAEGRDTKNDFAPYMGGPVDGPENGPPPLPWDIPCQPNVMFQTHHIKIEVPHTSVVRPCSGCDARGWNWCWRCGGRGKVRCTSCGGRGHSRHYDQRTKSHVNKTCSWCGGSGRRRCGTCGGDGRVTCRTCQGFGQLRCFILLTVTYSNHKEDYILETTNLPDELVRKAGGEIVFEETRLFLQPLVSYPVPEVNMNSQRLVSSHRTNWPLERMLNQRQTLRGVPVTEVKYKWDDIKTCYWVYGNEKKVYAPDYPHQCCWGCEIL